MINLEAEEYSRLCEELKLNFGYILRISVGGFSAYLAILNVGIGLQNATIIASSVIPAIIGLIIVCSIFKANYRLSGYIQIFYEGKDSNIYWETRLLSLKSEPGFDLNRIKLMIFSPGIVYVANIMISFIYFQKNPDVNIPLAFYSIQIFELVSFLIAIYSVIHLQKAREVYVNRWMDMQNKMI